MTEQELIEALEKATGPDRELDHWLQAFLVQTGYGQYKDADAWVRAAVAASWNTPVYSSSIDAALHLVPEGWGVCLVVETHTGLGRATVVMDGISGQFGYEHGEAATPAIALCIASLKARAHQRTQSDAPARSIP